MKYKAASIQYDSRILDKEYNIKQLTMLIEKAAAAGAKLVVLPEMCTTGYYFDSRDAIAEQAEYIPEGDTVKRFAELAIRLNCYLVVGMAEREEGRLYNSCFLTGPTGYLGKYRKIHPYTPDTLWANNGDLPFQVFDTPIGRIAMEICMDISFPEAPRIAKLLGAQVLCVPMNWCEPVKPSPIWITRAYENQMYLLASNRQGIERGYEFSGGSSVIGNDGMVLDCIMKGNGWAIGEIELDLSNDCICEEIPMRRPELYQELLLQRYHWPQNLFYRQYAVPTIPEGGMMEVAVADMQPVEGELTKNGEWIAKVMGEAASRGVSLLVFPELALTGVPKSAREAAKLARSEDDNEIRRLVELSLEINIAICFGFIQREGKNLYNALYCATGAGKSCVYKKSHLTVQDKKWAMAGDSAGIWYDMPQARIGILIGGEIAVMEPARLLAGKGCDMILVAAALEKATITYPEYSQEQYHWHIGRVRANENNTFVLFSNGKGGSGIFGPDMFKSVRDEAVVEGREHFAQFSICTENTIYNKNDKEWKMNPIREKMMLATRQTAWYDRLLQK